MATRTTTRTDDLSIHRTATREDAQLIVAIFNGPIAARAQDGMQVLWSYDKPPTFERFNAEHPLGSEGRRNVDAVLSLNETIGTFVKQGLLDRALVYDLLWVSGTWERCKALALHYRKETGVEEIYENFELLAKGQS